MSDFGATREYAKYQIRYYEEYPYAEKPEEVTRALSAEATHVLRAQLIELDEAAMAAKVKAILCYRSQISTFFKNDDEMAARVRAYANVVGAGRPAERLWVKPRKSTRKE